MRKSLALLGIIALILPLVFLGCGNDGSDGATGAPGVPGVPGVPGPGALANETCNLCHAQEKIADTAMVHAENLPENQGTVDSTTIDTVTFGTPSGDIVPVTVNFTFQALDSAGNDITSTIDLRTASGSNLSYVRFSIGHLVAGTAVEGNSNHWEGYVMNSGSNGSSRFYERVAGNLTGDPATGVYSYTFDNSVLLSDGYVDNAVHRVAIQLSGFPAGSFNPDPTVTRPVGNITADMVSAVATVTPFIDTPAGYPSKEVVTTAACNACHNPLAIHGGGRREIKFCQVCHNPKINTPAGPGGLDLVNLVHKIHISDNVIEWTAPVSGEEEIFDFSEVTFPQDPRNCTTCHQGGVDSDNWKTTPTIEACGACHGVDIFLPGGSHPGGSQTNSSGCALCHQADTGFAGIPSIPNSMATEESTPNNPQLPTGVADIQYFIDGATVDNDNVATVTFRITADNVALKLIPWPPAGFNAGTSPSFLLAWALPQDGISAPRDYNNLNSPQNPSGSTGNGAGQPPSVSLSDLIADNLVTTADNVTFQAVLSDTPYPAGARMRAVALQGEMEQNTGTDDVGRTAPSKVFAIDSSNSNPARRQVVDSNGCLECHERLELHGGNRVNNVQVCVFCHNPNLSSSGRTSTSNVNVPPSLGTDPLAWPEATNDIKELIHGIHAATDRPYEFIRNRGGGRYYNWSEVTFPGNLADCQKCHLEGTYNVAPDDSLWTTERITTGNAAETLDDIIGARSTVPNMTDLVNSPTASACFYCHDDGTSESHIVLQGGKLSYEGSAASTTREEALGLP